MFSSLLINVEDRFHNRSDCMPIEQVTDKYQALLPEGRQTVGDKAFRKPVTVVNGGA